MSNLWLTSDTHFGHENIIAFSGRPFDNVKEMNEALLEYWNETVKPSDTVYHFGDVAMGHFVDSWEYVKKLNGTIHLIIGNHDRVAKRYHVSQKYVDRFTPLYEERFASMQYSLELHGFLCHHLPYYGDHVGEERFTEHRPADTGKWLLHGHVHEEWLFKDKMVNVGVDVWDFRPVHFDTILDATAAKGYWNVSGNHRSSQSTATS